MSDPGVEGMPVEGRPPPPVAEVVFSVVDEKCLGCGACASLVPGIIDMRDNLAVIVRQPVTKEEISLTEAALFNCPGLAIRKRSKL
jgi:ferredoxin